MLYFCIQNENQRTSVLCSSASSGGVLCCFESIKMNVYEPRALRNLTAAAAGPSTRKYHHSAPRAMLKAAIMVRCLSHVHVAFPAERTLESLTTIGKNDDIHSTRANTESPDQRAADTIPTHSCDVQKQKPSLRASGLICSDQI